MSQAQLSVANMPQTIYHGSASFFDEFTLASAGQKGRSSNGGLGIWVTPDIDIASIFTEDEGFLYELLIVDKPVKKVPLQWLMKTHDEARDIEDNQGLEAAIRFYDRIRVALIDKGFGQLWIVESDGSASTRVVLDHDDIEILSVSEMQKPAPFHL